MAVGSPLRGCLARLLALLLALSLAAAQGQPFSRNALYGVTYAPFNLDLDSICLPTARVTEDMAIIAEVADRVRLYNVAVCPEATDAVLDFAAENGMRVVLGLFISNDTALNMAEMGAVVPLLEAYGAIVDAVVVGNEAVFVGGVDPFVLVSYVEDTRKALRESGFQHPVSTAEVWPIFESPIGPTIANASDFICLQMQPYWEGWDVVCPENTPFECLGAGEYVHAKAAGLERLFGKQVWACESGWPTEGERCCQGSRDNARDGLLAGPSVENATIFMSDFVRAARQEGRPFFYHTVFDGEWKRIWAPCMECKGLDTQLTNPMCNTCEVDYHWGFYDFTRNPKPGFTLVPAP
ncbi:unnamed protein product [Ostreobium quekettii]|uniref:glucan endo-1,3-beta-D-glucosidase n=1 Tax=Ostreobium quekettii TaxID=121088 RepID=A0A8S1IW07_9CHLO|nr:unnamed protein product [Ostreobium quekettii]|eukprot:evm.model.scf_439.5 EVM.evm.TU.scf_439.5   scf_439:35337-38544(-)